MNPELLTLLRATQEHLRKEPELRAKVGCMVIDDYIREYIDPTYQAEVL